MVTLFEKYNVSQGQIVLVLALIGWIIYLNFTTIPVPNYNNETGKVMYGVKSFVPPTYVTGNQAFIGIGLVIMLFLSFKMKETQKVRVTERQFKEYLTRQIKLKQEIPLPNGKLELPQGEFTIDKDFITVYIMEKEKRTPIRYVAQVIITDKNGVPTYYIMTGNPITMMIDDIIETKEKLSLADKCPDCGRFPDEKLVLEEDLKKFKAIRKYFSSD